MRLFCQSLIKLSSSVLSEQRDVEGDLTVPSASISFKFTNKEFLQESADF